LCRSDGGMVADGVASSVAPAADPRGQALPSVELGVPPTRPAREIVLQLWSGHQHLLAVDEEESPRLGHECEQAPRRHRLGNVLVEEEKDRHVTLALHAVPIGVVPDAPPVAAHGEW